MKKIVFIQLSLFAFLFSGTAFAAEDETPYPTLEEKVNYQISLSNDGSAITASGTIDEKDATWLCRYKDKTPYAEANLGHPIALKLKKIFLKSIFKSVFTYGEWKKVYKLSGEDWGKYKDEYEKTLENPDDKQGKLRRKAIDKIVAQTNYEGFMVVLCGEHRDFPAMLKRKIDVLLTRTPVVPAGEMSKGKFSVAAFRRTDNIWQFFSGDAYTRLLNVTSTMYYYWLEKGNAKVDEEVVNYNFTDPNSGEIGPNGGYTNRTMVSVEPISHCMMKFIFEKYLVAKKEVVEGKEVVVEKEVVGEDFDGGYKTYKADKKKCSTDDKLTYYNFRGHKNLQPLWLDSNGMIWNSRLAARRAVNAKTDDEKKDSLNYYQHPFASRYKATTALWGGFLYYPEDQQAFFREASESGGGNQIYYLPSLYQSDLNAAGLPNFIKTDWPGQGDSGLSSQAHPVSEVLEKPITSSWFGAFYIIDVDVSYWDKLDWGFLELLDINKTINGRSPEKLTFALRMQRLNQAIDRHTNWGPTMLVDPTQKIIYSAYSPLVACSYMIDASHNFATGDYPTTHPDEQGKTKWMYIMKFKKDRYYNEDDLRDGKIPNWKLGFFNEASLSNDYYTERALDHVATIPPENIDANLYLVEATTNGGW